MTSVQAQSLINEKTQDKTLLPKNWYCVQRLHERKSAEGKRGVDRIVVSDYMGSAEFEDGRVGKSWRLMREHCKSGDYTMFHLEVESSNFARCVTVVCHKNSDLESLQSMMNVLAGGARDRYILEPTFFNEWFNATGPTEGRADNIAWLAVDNSYPAFWSVNLDLAASMFAELCIKKGVKAEDLTLFDTKKFDHHGRTHTGRLVGIYDNYALLECADIDLTGRQRISYAEIWK